MPQVSPCSDPPPPPPPPLSHSGSPLTLRRNGAFWLQRTEVEWVELHRRHKVPPPPLPCPHTPTLPRPADTSPFKWNAERKAQSMIVVQLTAVTLLFVMQEQYKKKMYSLWLGDPECKPCAYARSLCGGG